LEKYSILIQQTIFPLLYFQLLQTFVEGVCRWS